MLEFQVTKGQGLWRTDKDIVSADTTDLKAHFTLTADFTGTITVWWRRSDMSNTYTSTLAADGTCTIPAEALAATDKAVYGPYDHDVFVSISDTGRTTTNEYKLTVQRSAFSTDATPGTGGSPTAYEELVEQFDELKEENQAFKDDMTEQQETFESTVTENVNNIRYVVETETAPPIIEEASGAEITLDDSAYRQVRDLQLYGYSKQVQTTGAQLIKYPYIGSDGYTNNGITYTVSDDGTITANGTATDQSLFFVASEQSDWRPSGSVFLSGCPSGGSFVTYRMQLYNYNSNKDVAMDDGKGVAVNFTNADTQWNLCIRIAPGYTVNNLTFKPMLNAGTSALPWEPYSGGYASPSPDWAQPIHSVADEVNLLNFPDVESVASDGVTWSCKGGAVSATGNATGQANTIYSDLSYIFPIKSGTYKISGANDKILIIARITKSDDSISYLEDGFTLDGTEKEVQIYVRAANTGAISSTIYPMLNRGSTALPYRPYGHNVTVESAGANLFDISKMFSVSNFTAEQNGEYTIFKATQSGYGRNYFVRSPLDDVEDGETVHISYDDISLISPLRLQNRMSDGSQTDPPDTSKETSAQTPGSKLFVTGNVFGGTDTAVSNGQTAMCKDLMVNRGSTPLPWQPYVAPSSALIALTDSLRGIPVTSGGTYTDDDGQQWIADYIYRRVTDGKWMLWRNIKCAEYDGSTDEVWNVSVAGDNIFATSDFSGVPLNGLCNRFRYKNNPESAGEFEFDTNYSFRFYTGLNGVPAWRTWLQSNPLEVVYQLATPTVEELPDDVQTELNGLYTYNLHTDMWNNDGAYMGLKYVADTKTWINNKIAGLSTAMLNQN